MIHPRRAAAGALATLASLTLAACGGDGSDATGPGSIADHSDEACAHDDAAPVLSSLTATPNVLWPPNHEMVPVAISVVASDACSGVTSSIVGVTSDEPVDGRGDGHTSPDWIVTGPLTLLVRSERSGLGDGRVYTITVRASDASGNETTGATTVTVPHDQGND
jgi:hypothetical protein